MDERCGNCHYWSRHIKKQKGGWCVAWSPQDYHQKRGRGSSRWFDYGPLGVAADDDQWCAKWTAKHDTASKER